MRIAYTTFSLLKERTKICARACFHANGTSVTGLRTVYGAIGFKATMEWEDSAISGYEYSSSPFVRNVSQFMVVSRGPSIDTPYVDKSCTRKFSFLAIANDHESVFRRCHSATSWTLRMSMNQMKQLLGKVLDFASRGVKRGWKYNGRSQSSQVRACSSMFRYRQKRRAVSTWALLMPCLVGFYLWRMHRSYVSEQKESPFDHVFATLRKTTLWGWCPTFHVHTQQELAVCEKTPPLFMINGRPRNQRPKASILSWKNVTRLEMIDTSEITRNLTTANKCRHSTWTSRLFQVYQQIFSLVLEKHSSMAFVFFEDDAVLTSLEDLQREICIAQLNDLTYYSFYTTQLQGSSCIYTHGTCGFYIKRELMKKIIGAPMEDVCRLGIDIYISSIGPWFASQNHAIQHNSQRYKPPFHWYRLQSVKAVEGLHSSLFNFLTFEMLLKERVYQSKSPQNRWNN